MSENKLDYATEKVTTEVAAKELNIGVDTLHYMMRNNMLPIGYAMKKKDGERYSYLIYRGLLDAYKKSLCNGEIAF